MHSPPKWQKTKVYYTFIDIHKLLTLHLPQRSPGWSNGGLLTTCWDRTSHRPSRHLRHETCHGGRNFSGAAHPMTSWVLMTPNLSLLMPHLTILQRHVMQEKGIVKRITTQMGLNLSYTPQVYPHENSTSTTPEQCGLSKYQPKIQTWPTAKFSWAGTTTCYNN